MVEIVITGVAGYIGAHIASKALELGHSVIGIDNFSTGKRTFLDPRVRFHQGDVEDFYFLSSIFENIIEPTNAGVIHCAGLKFAGESVKNPLAYYEANSFAVLSLLKSMKKANVLNLVFSSSCSVYGEIQDSIPVDELTELRPISPYGRSKMVAEMMIRDSIQEGWINAVSLRYFNVVGNSNISAFDTSVFNLFPNIYRAILNKGAISVFGNEHKSRDGTCVRDYIHIDDLANVHLEVLEKISNKVNLEFAYNLGSGIGYSVLEIIQAASRLIASDLKYTFDSAREGDPAEILADISLAQRDLSWSNLKCLDEMLQDGWVAWQRNSHILG